MAAETSKNTVSKTRLINANLVIAKEESIDMSAAYEPEQSENSTVSPAERSAEKVGLFINRIIESQKRTYYLSGNTFFDIKSKIIAFIGLLMSFVFTHSHVSEGSKSPFSLSMEYQFGLSKMIFIGLIGISIFFFVRAALYFLSYDNVYYYRKYMFSSAMFRFIPVSFFILWVY